MAALRGMTKCHSACRCWVYLLVLASKFAATAEAHTLPETKRDTTCPPPKSSAQVTDAYKADTESPDDTLKLPPKLNRTVKLGQTIVVRVDSLAHLLQQKKCAEKDGRSRALVLFLDDQPLADLSPYPPTDPDQPELRFPLRRTEASREVWTRVLGKPSWNTRRTKVSVGLEDSYAVPSKAHVQLEVLPRSRLIFWFLIVALLATVFLVMGRKSAMLRDGVATPGARSSAYSLARVQAAWWFFCILASYLLIGMVTGDFTTSITGTVLVLLGISSGTAVGAAIVDASKATPAKEAERESKGQDVLADLQVLEPLETQAKAASAAAPQDDALRNTVTKVKLARETKEAQLRDVRNESANFLQDILSDANGVNFHRFQMASWTLVLAVVFLSHVYRELAMPQFSETLLALLGISAGTYLGLKLPEPTVPKAP